MASFQDRLIGAIKLQAATFEEVEHDVAAMSQAATVVVLASLANGFAWIWYGGIFGILRGTVFALIGWVIGAALIWVIGTKVMPGKNTEADIGQLLRTLGFAQAPGIFYVIAVIPILGWLVWPVVLIWTLVAAVIAVRQALDYDDTLKAVIVCVIAWAVSLVFSMIVGGAAFMSRRIAY